MTTNRDGSKVTEFKIRGNPNAATGRAERYWNIMDAMIREAGLDKPAKKGLFDFFPF